jgi:hypothetical protein
MSDSEKIQSIIFGFGYRARSGKDTVVAAILEGRSNLYKIKRYGFADELKREVNEAALKSGGMRNLFSDGLRGEGCGFLQTNGNVIPLPEWVQPDPNAPMDDPFCPLGKERLLLQWWGGEFRRGADPDYWIKKVAQHISEDNPEVALISDVRYLNEVRFVQKYGEAIKVDRPGLPSLHGAAGVHASELALADFQDWDDVIVNDANLETLRERALFSFDMLLSSIPSARPTSA